MTGAAAHSDVLIVGAGSAGSVVAEQLSRNPECGVTVLEAGPGLADPTLAARVADGSRLPIDAASPLVRRYQTELTGRAGNRATIVRGATVGGSGAVNGGYFCRGLPGDFDGLGVPGWTWPDVLEHFRLIETDLDFPGPVHGTDGPIPVRRVREKAGGTELFVTAAQRAGLRWTADLNDTDRGPVQSAELGAVPLNIVDGVRVGPGTGYLQPALGRANLNLRTQTRAVRVDIAKQHAVGVSAIGPDGPVELKADRIVLCAGAIESAHLLMLSGVGDEAMLRSVGVQVVAALPVGMNCADHPEWIMPVDWPATPGHPVLEVVLHTADGVEIRPYTSGFAAMTGAGGSGGPDRPHIGVALMRPLARGRLTLTSADPGVAPRIEHRYDSEPDDVARLRRGCELVREIIGGTAEVGTATWSTSQHLCGSAPIGMSDDGAVLDRQCRVHGVEGLWVIDGSVLPEITSRGPHASIVMLAHRAAEFIGAH